MASNTSTSLNAGGGGAMKADIQATQGLEKMGYQQELTRVCDVQNVLWHYVEGCV